MLSLPTAWLHLKDLSPVLNSSIFKSRLLIDELKNIKYCMLFVGTGKIFFATEKLTFVN